jgi:hypothetical protein
MLSRLYDKRSGSFTSLARRKTQKHIKAAKIKMPESGAYFASALSLDLSISFVSMRHQLVRRFFNRGQKTVLVVPTIERRQ